MKPSEVRVSADKTAATLNSYIPRRFRRHDVDNRAHVTALKHRGRTIDWRVLCTDTGCAYGVEARYVGYCTLAVIVGKHEA